MVESITGQLRRGLQLQLVLKAGSIGIHGFRAEREGFCDLLDGPASSDQDKDREFSLRQCALARAIGIHAEADGDMFSERRGDVHAAGQNLFDGIGLPVQPSLIHAFRLGKLWWIALAL